LPPTPRFRHSGGAELAVLEKVEGRMAKIVQGVTILEVKDIKRSQAFYREMRVAKQFRLSGAKRKT
jgi:hypothetical protein